MGHSPRTCPPEPCQRLPLSGVTGLRTAGRASGPWGSHHAHALRELAGARPIAHHPAHTLHAQHAVRARTGAMQPERLATNNRHIRLTHGGAISQGSHMSCMHQRAGQWRARAPRVGGAGAGSRKGESLHEAAAWLSFKFVVCGAEQTGLPPSVLQFYFTVSAHLPAKHSWKGKVLRQSACAHQHRGLQCFGLP